MPDDTGGGRLVLARGNGTGFRAYQASTPLPAGVWHHVAVTSPAANNSATFYLNGAAVGAVGPAMSSGPTTLADGTTPASIGRREDGASFTNGVARRVLMRNAVLTPAEIAQEYAYG